jgi:hypothetical protein
MIIVADRTSLTAHVFYDAIERCPREACPVGHPEPGPAGGLCVLGLKDHDVVCLASFTSPLATLGCEHTAPCEHIDPDHPALLPLLERLADAVEPQDVRRARAVAALRARIQARLGTEPPAAAPDHRTPGQQVVDRIRARAPQALDALYGGKA